MTHTKPSRYPIRGTEDKKIVYQIIDEGLFCTIAFHRNDVAHQIPTGFARVDDDIYIHGSSKSNFIDTIVGEKVSFSITHLDSLVLAPTAFDHSFNYRSVIGFSKAIEIKTLTEKLAIFNLFTDRYIPGRIADIGAPTSAQINSTRIIKLALVNAAAKVRNGDVNVKINSKNAAWCGLIPIKQNYGEPIIDHQLEQDKTLPDYIAKLVAKKPK